MAIGFQWLGHSTFLLDVDGHVVLPDPFLRGNPLAAAAPETLHPELIVVSHGHSDHVSDAVSIARQSNAIIIGNVEVCHWLQSKGAPEVRGMNTGGSASYGFLTARLTVAFHSSSMPDGSYGGSPNGFILTATASGQRMYFAGDTALFSDMELIGDARIDVAFLPIGDYFTMGIADSIRAIRYLRPRFVVPMHYNTFPIIQQDASGWANRVSSETSAVPIVLDPGGRFVVPSPV